MMFYFVMHKSHDDIPAHIRDALTKDKPYCVASYQKGAHTLIDVFATQPEAYKCYKRLADKRDKEEAL